MARLRRAQVRVGDSMQSFAQRELGDFSAWRGLVELNGLMPPYLIASTQAGDRREHTVIWGDLLNVPARSVAESAVVGADALGADVALRRGRLQVDGGDLAVVSGSANLVQAIGHRCSTMIQSYWPHPRYGCELPRLLGAGNQAVVSLLGASMAKRAAERDPRVASAAAAGQVSGDKLRVALSIKAVTKDAIDDFNLIYQVPRG